MVISTGAGGNSRFMFRHEENALLVETQEIGRVLAAAVEQALEDPPLAHALVRAATGVAESCRWPAIRKTIYAAYGFPFEESAPARTEAAHH